MVPSAINATPSKSMIIAAHMSQSSFTPTEISAATPRDPLRFITTSEENSRSSLTVSVSGPLPWAASVQNGCLARQPFWTEAAQGRGPLTLTVSDDREFSSLVVMNRNGSRGVAADISVGVKLDWLIWAAIIMLLLGVALIALGTMLVVKTLRR